MSFQTCQVKAEKSSKNEELGMLVCKVHPILAFSKGNGRSKEEGKGQESIQSNTTPDARLQMGKCQNTRKHIIQEVSPFPAGCN